MARIRFRSLVSALCLAIFSVGASAVQAGWVTVADWQFNPSNPGGVLTDSSGNGNTLTNNGNVTFGFDPVSGNNYAAFSGNGLLNTATPLNLSSYAKLQISWSMEVTSSSTGILLETSADYNSNHGAFVIATGAGSGPTAATTGVADLNTSAPSVWTFTHADGTPTPVWDNYVETIDPTQALLANVLQLTRNGSPDSSAGAPQNAVPPGFTFADEVAYIGQRFGGIAPWNGNLANLEIQGLLVPEPSSAILSVMGLVGFGGWIVRRRGHSK